MEIEKVKLKIKNQNNELPVESKKTMVVVEAKGGERV